jgi:type IV fimbrial biogenesis protein FimT
MTPRRACSGFTLIEMMIAVVIAILLVMLALPSFSTFLRNREVRSTTESIANGLRLARSEAIRRNMLVSFRLTGAGGSASWSVSQVSNNAAIQSYSSNEGGTRVQVAVQPAGAVSVAFNRLGRIVPVAVGTPTVQQIDIGSAISADARALRIYVDGVHGVRTCDPSPAIMNLVPHDARAC